MSAALASAGGIRGSRLALSARWFHLVTMSFRAVSQASNAWRVCVVVEGAGGVERLGWAGAVEAGEGVCYGGAFVLPGPT